MDYWDRPSGRPLREIPRDGDNHAFLLKALHEAGDELGSEFYNLSPRQLSRKERDEWSLIQIAGHLRDREQVHLSYLQAILSSRRPVLDVVDFAQMVEDGDYQPRELREFLYAFAELRERCLYLLYDLSNRQWQREGEHPYRGALNISQIVKEMNEHDLAHLWQVKRLKERIL